MSTYPIDFVVPWVDPNDPIWKDSFIKYSKEAGLYSDSSEKRYRDWDLFKYWFRGVELHAPWVNKIHLITAGHYPKWLNINHPKINLVKHSDYIPPKHLPTFSVNPIELNLHRINSLSEHFVYFNDDIFIISPIKPSLFFKKGLPCDAAVMTAFSGTGFTRMVINSNIIINKYNDKVSTLKKKPFNFFNPRYGIHQIRNILLLPWREFTGFYDFHTANSYLKSTFSEVWDKEYELLDQASSRKFRHSLDLNQAVFRYWQLVNNKFTPISKHRTSDFYKVGVDPFDKVLSSLNNEKKPLICLNDHDPEDLDKIIAGLKTSFEKKFPNKSTFEI